MIKATQLTEKSWLLSKKKGRYGLLRKVDEAYAIMGGPFSGKYENLEILEKEVGEKLKFVKAEKREDRDEIFLEGYPVKHSEIFDTVMEKTPTYTKKEGSSDRYAAGYWCINFRGKWHGHYCPRVKTLEENEHIGPLKTKLEMDHSLKVNNK